MLVAAGPGICFRVGGVGVAGLSDEDDGALGVDDSLASVRPVLDRWPNFRELLLQDYDEAFTSLRKAEGIGCPLGTADFVIELERRLGRSIARRAPGRKAAATAQGEQLNLLQ
jgi:hypothetical protein